MRINFALLSLVFLTGCIFPSAFEQELVLQDDGSDADGDTEVGVDDTTEVGTDVETDVGDHGETEVVDEVVDVPAGETLSDTVVDVQDVLDVPTCENGNFDPAGETDVDCGGSCAPCGVGSACLAPSDCVSRLCTSGFCQARGSCLQWLRLNGALVDGVYPIDPDGVGGMDAFEAYCNMTAGGGGWTLAFNVETLIASQSGSTTQVCYNESCINAAYSTIPIADLMFDVSNASIVGENQEARTVVEGVHPGLFGRTLQKAFTAGTKLFVEAEDNSNVKNGDEVNCDVTTPWQTWRLMICEHFVIVFNDLLSGGQSAFIGFDNSWTNPYNNVYGWDTVVGDDWFPRHFRVWVREAQ